MAVVGCLPVHGLVPGEAKLVPLPRKAAGAAIWGVKGHLGFTDTAWQHLEGGGKRGPASAKPPSTLSPPSKIANQGRRQFDSGRSMKRGCARLPFRRGRLRPACLRESVRPPQRGRGAIVTPCVFRVDLIRREGIFNFDRRGARPKRQRGG